MSGWICIRRAHASRTKWMFLIASIYLVVPIPHVSSHREGRGMTRVAGPNEDDTHYLGCFSQSEKSEFMQHLSDE